MSGPYRMFGASVRGPGHVRAGLPNQDAFLTFSGNISSGVVLSDGLGSCRLSDRGAKAVCCSVVSEMQKVDSSRCFDGETFVAEVLKRYCASIDVDSYAEYMATCLWGFVPGDGNVYLGMLGDGLASILLSSGEVLCLEDDKKDSFSNIVVSMSPRVKYSDWKIVSVPEELVSAVLLCSDGVSDDMTEVSGFIKEFVSEYAVGEVREHEISEMLEAWPVPMHTDDKTIVCLARRGL